MAIILVVPEAVKALQRKPPTDKRLIKFLNGYDDPQTMPESWEARWLAAEVLAMRGHTFMPKPKEK